MASQPSIRLRTLRKVNSGSSASKIARKVIEDEFGYDFDPVLELIRLARSTDNDLVAANCYAAVCKFCYPQLKSVEMKSTTLHEVVMSDMELANRFRKYMENTDTCER
jgi:hypothetical protein